MKAIYKYPLEITDAIIQMPEGAEIVKVENQNGHACIWAIVDSEAPKQFRYFTVVGTGHPIPEHHRYVASWQSPPFVWHLFEEAALIRQQQARPTPQEE